jgi:hypothetical protein
MFFYIGNSCELLNQVDDNLFLDQGWTRKGESWYKGYSTECSIGQNIDAILNGYQPRGVWALIQNNKVYHSDLRGFPLYSKGSELTNIPNLNDFKFVYNEINWSSNFTELPLEEVIDKTLEIFLENVNGFVKYNPDVNLTVVGTGGLDSTLSWAAIHNISKYTLARTKQTSREYSSPLIEHMRKNHWAYNVINISSSDVFNLTGFAAEVMTMRGYDVFNLVCRTLGTTVYDVIKPSDYLYYFLQRKNIRDRLNEATEISTNLRKDMLASIDCDYYMWHIDNNFHFSPFYDKRIPEICVRMNMDDIIENCKNGTVERLMLEKINPKFLALVSNFKNYGNVLANFDKNLKNI